MCKLLTKNGKRLNMVIDVKEGKNLVSANQGFISVSSNELSYLIALIGGKVLPGIEFNENSLTDPKIQMDEIQRKLEKKFIIQINFDGTLQLANEIFEELSIVAFCTRVINQTVQIKGITKHYQYFFRDNDLVELIYGDSDTYTLRRIWALHDLQLSIVERNCLQEAYEMEFKKEKVELVNKLTHYCTLNSFMISNDSIQDVRESSFLIADNRLLRVNLGMNSETESNSYTLEPIEFNQMMMQTTQFVSSKE